MRFAAERARVVAEGAAACAIAAALKTIDRARDAGDRSPQKVVAVVSGGNIDLSRFAEIVGASRS